MLPSSSLTVPDVQVSRFRFFMEEFCSRRCSDGRSGLPAADAAWAVSGIPQADPEGMATPRFWHRLIRFRHVISGLLALASLNLACRNLVPTFPQRSPPLLLTTAACGGLRSAPDCRPRRTFLHLSYSYAAPFGPAILVTRGPDRTYALALRQARTVFVISQPPQVHRTNRTIACVGIQKLNPA